MYKHSKKSLKHITKSNKKNNINNIKLLFNTSSNNLNISKSIHKLNSSNISTYKLDKLLKYPSPIIVDLNIKSHSKYDIDKIIYEQNIQIVNSIKLYQNIEEKEKKKISKIIQNISHNLSTYINKTFFGYDTIKGISNGYAKLWEIYHIYGKQITSHIKSSSKNEKVTILHMCEAPGNWIKCTRHYITRFYPEIRYDWYANSLNPNNKENKEKYGNGKIFDDELKYMATYPQKWLFGNDNTGDITRVANIKQFAILMHKQNMKLITGDAGLSNDMDIYILQKLEVAQLVMCLACSTSGANCIIKNFANSYIASDKDKFKKSINYVASLISIYCKFYKNVHIMKPITSNPLSGEYYIIGINFKGISNTQLDYYYKLLDDFEIDMILNDISKDETDIIHSCLAQIYNLQTSSYDMLNVLFLCKSLKETTSKDAKQCNYYLENSFKFNQDLFKMWMKKNNYVPIFMTSMGK